MTGSGRNAAASVARKLGLMMKRTPILRMAIPYQAGSSYRKEMTWSVGFKKTFVLTGFKYQLTNGLKAALRMTPKNTFDFQPHPTNDAGRTAARATATTAFAIRIVLFATLPAVETREKSADPNLWRSDCGAVCCGEAKGAFCATEPLKPGDVAGRFLVVVEVLPGTLDFVQLRIAEMMAVFLQEPSAVLCSGATNEATCSDVFDCGPSIMNADNSASLQMLSHCRKN